MSILQQFLNLQFIKTDETGAVENLEKVVSKIVKQLSKQRSKIIAYTLVALDPEVNENDPVIKEVEELIFKEWRTFRNSAAKTQDSPVTYIRAVILEALEQLAEHVELAGIIWHSGRNLIGRYSLGREGEMISAFLAAIGDHVYSESVGYWSGRPDMNLPKITWDKLEIPNGISSVVRKEDIERHFIAALVGNANGGENPSTLTFNRNYNRAEGFEEWGDWASKRAAKGLAEEINKAVSKQDGHINKTTKSIGDAISNLSEKWPTFFKSLTDSILASFEANGRRERLLWWKESLYSPSLRKGYRTLPDLDAIFAMAIDYSKLVSPIYPESIDYFLIETLRDLMGEKAYAKMPFQELVAEFGTLSVDSRRMLDLFSTEQEGRVLLGSAILAGGFKENANAVDFLSLCGVNKSVELSRTEFLLWLFHDAQAMNLVNQKQPAK